MSDKEKKYKNELKKLEGMFGMTFTEKERDKIVQIKIEKERKIDKGYKETKI